MIDIRFFEELSRRLGQSIPPAINEWQTEVEKNARELFEAMLRRMDLVTREEFEVQASVLSRAQEKISALEARVRELEARTSSTAISGG